MRLSNLKLSGFKSFADSTTLSFRSNRTAVVGPNGCGKSNVIDAIRWVMGESSARQLRGGNMQDVIFTGTSKRKPVGMASVELRFENTYGKLGGAYNAYTELAVRRQVTREGKSEYFLNGTKCRRRDITDIFLGTGLGPRSYAIIEQGMINRLVDAKPEEMRVFIEEAAGVSRYQARRRETLQHLDHTTANLERLEDIAGELKSQLKTLKRQSEAAVQYKTLEQQIQRLKIEIISYQAEHSSRLQQEYSVEMNSLGEQFKLVRSEVTQLEHDLTNTSALFQRLIQQSTPLQQEWQQAEKSLAELKYNFEQKQNLIQFNQTQLQQLQQQKNDARDKYQMLDVQLEHLYAEQAQAQHELTQLEQQHQGQQQQSQDLNQQQQQIVAQYEQSRRQIEAQQQQLQQMQQQLQQLDKSLARTEQQKTTLLEQLRQLNSQQQLDDIDDLALEQQQLLEQQQQVQQQLHSTQQSLIAAEQQLHTLQQERQQLQADVKALESEEKTLTALLVKAKSSDEDNLPRLMDQLQLTAKAQQHAAVIEKFLSHWLSARVLDAGDAFQKQLPRQLYASKIKANIQTAKQAAIADLECLSAWIIAPDNALWSQVYLCDTLEQALAQQSALATGQTILSLDGYHLGADWLLALDYDEQSHAAQGALSHRIRLDQIAQSLSAQRPILAQREQDCSLAEQQLKQCKQHLSEQQKQLALYQQQQQKMDVERVKLHSQQQALAMQQAQIQQQLQQIEAQFEEDAMHKDDLDIDLHALQMKLEQAMPAYKTLQMTVSALDEQQGQAEQRLRAQQVQVESTRLAALSQQQQIELLEKEQSFIKLQQQQLVQHIEQAQKIVEPIQLELPSLDSQLKLQQQQTEELQKTWSSWQVELHAVQEKQQQLTHLRQERQQQDERLRTELEQRRLSWQATQSDLQHFGEQIKDLDAELLTGLDIDLKQHQTQLAQIQQQFSKLGAVNLAAAEEFEEVTQRYAQLSHQIDDLEKTVQQLNDAMKSIDQQTRKLFMNTFDQVNAELQLLFPKVFNGGEAQLSLEGDWQSGVKLMARPPGKKNSSLALLSGGEKALTALALVFAIFRLNPAPFCVLDEVDAPLDDANVGRFCNLVKELSEQVQFIYITHNKVAMTMATDLLGVTMPEPGASKLVSVNLEEAKEYGLVAES